MLLLLATAAGAASTLAAGGTITGTVRDRESGGPVAWARVEIIPSGPRTATDALGRFRIEAVEPGIRRIEARGPGFAPAGRTVEVAPGTEVEVHFLLEPDPIPMQGIEIHALRPDLRPEARVDREEIRGSNPVDAGEILRTIAGTDAVRRGPVGFDPVVRGLQETEVGVYIDGARWFPAGPARMDSPLSHLDPAAVHRVEIVQGPYALTWGPGNLSAIRVRSRPLDGSPDGRVHGTAGGGYDTNVDLLRTLMESRGGGGRLSWALSGAGRVGDDFEDGGGDVVPGDFRSSEARARLRIRSRGGDALTFAAGYQDQSGIDYPGRLLDADFFHARDFRAQWTRGSGPGPVRSLEVTAWAALIAHRMNNDAKPTAQPDPGRTPPFPLDVRIDAGVSSLGARAAFLLSPGGRLDLEAGADLHRVRRDAFRVVENRDTGDLLFEDIVWPDARITNFGVFLRADRSFGPLRTSGTIRVDRVRAVAGETSEFFRENTEGPLDADETHIGGAASVSIAIGPHWSLSGGAGRVARTADATERYSDRFPASKAQMSAEFMGDPGLDAERSTQVDLWIDADYPGMSARVAAFHRVIDGYITLEATDLPKRLPLSPDTVFRYINGEAVFRGIEAAVTRRLGGPFALDASVAWTWAQDRTLGEPAIGIPPLRTDVGLRCEPGPGRPFRLEAVVHRAERQDRVAGARGELPTPAHTTADLRAAWELRPGTELRGGVVNLTDRRYVRHLNAKNPFTGESIAEPGRRLYAGLNVTF
jgi:iron complex outermembrane receptor protein